MVVVVGVAVVRVVQRAGAQLQVGGRVKPKPGALLSAMLIEVRSGTGACSCRRPVIMIIIGEAGRWARLVTGSRSCRVFVSLVTHFQQLLLGLVVVVALAVDG